jgi:hypothetical protein
LTSKRSNLQRRTRRNLWLACALGYKACKEDFSVLYHRIPRLFAALALARGDGRYAKLLRALGRVKLLILDDWGPETLSPDQARDLLEIVEDRYAGYDFRQCDRDYDSRLHRDRGGLLRERQMLLAARSRRMRAKAHELGRTI